MSILVNMYGVYMYSIELYLYIYIYNIVYKLIRLVCVILNIHLTITIHLYTIHPLFNSLNTD